MRTVFAQSNRALVRRAILGAADFTTYGNLSGRAYSNSPNYIYPGHIHGGAYNQLQGDLTAGRIEYVLFSYATPIAWLRNDGTWVIDHTRHGAASDKALSTVTSVVSDLSGGTHIAVNYRHHFSDAQYVMMQNAITERVIVLPRGQEKRTAFTLLREGYLERHILGGYTATDLGRAVFYGYAIELCYSPRSLKAVAA